jgi:hypothetical protein
MTFSFYKFSELDSVYFIYNPKTKKGIFIHVNEIGISIPVGICDFNFLQIRFYSNNWKLEKLDKEFLSVITASQYKCTFLFDYSMAIDFLNDSTDSISNPNYFFKIQ